MNDSRSTHDPKCDLGSCFRLLSDYSRRGCFLEWKVDPVCLLNLVTCSIRGYRYSTHYTISPEPPTVVLSFNPLDPFRTDFGSYYQKLIQAGDGSFSPLIKGKGM